MKLNNASISILVDRDRTVIRLFDEDSCANFAEVLLTPEQLSSALSRLSNTPCEIEVKHLDRIGKKMEHKSLVFELPKNVEYNKRKELAYKLAVENCPDGWTPDNYFGAQDSFFSNGKKEMAKCTIRRYV